MDESLAALHRWIRAAAALLRATALAITSRSASWPGSTTAVTARKRIRVPGFPASSLNDETWQGAWPDAIELSGVPGGLWENVAAHGLLVPAAWADGPGWPALWARAR